MKCFLLLASFAVFSLSCQKTKERLQEEMIIKAITDGVWRITRYTKGGTDMTADYTDYRFQFYMNYTVDAINNGTTETKGTWQADVPTKVVAVAFTSASDLLVRLNGNWLITRNNWTFVEATQTVNGEVLTLRIDK